MKCTNCGYDFNGNFCPKCGTKAFNQPNPEEYSVAYENQNADENPYEKIYNQPKDEQPEFTSPQQNQPYQPAQNPQQNYSYQQPQTNSQQYTQYNPEYLQQYTVAPPKKGMSGGKIAALVISIVLGVMLIVCGTPFAMVACISTIESMDEDGIQINNNYYGLNDTVTVDNCAYTLTKIEYNDKYEGMKPEDGKTFMMLTVEMQNISSRAYDPEAQFSCYADEYLCSDYSDYEDYYYSENSLSPGKKVQVTLAYEIPKDAESITLDVLTYDYDSMFSNEKQFTFTVK